MARSFLRAIVVLAVLCGAATAVHAASDATVEAVQRALNERGFDAGAIDGAMGSRTAAALRRFQRSVGLPVTGRIDEATRTALGLQPPAATDQSGAREADAEAKDVTSKDTDPTPSTADTTPNADAPPSQAGQSEAGAASDAVATPVESKQTESTGAEPTGAESTKAEPTGAESTRTESTRTESTGAEPTGAESTKAESTRAELTRAEPTGAGSARTGSTETDTSSGDGAKPSLGFAVLGWHPPQTGTDALARFDALGAPPEFRRGHDTLFVPKGEFVFILEEGERFPGLECDPGAGRLVIEFVFGPDGPVIFTPAAGGEYCQAGIGIVIEVGRTLEMRPVDWGDLKLPQGTLQVTGQGLRYVD